MERFLFKEGDCAHCFNDICDTSKAYQNYLCPYVAQQSCPSYVKVTKEMAESWEHKGYMHYSFCGSV